MTLYHHKIKVILIFLATAVLVSCAYAEKSRGKLSEAVEKSNDDYDGERKVADTQESDDEESGGLLQFILDLLSSDDNDDQGKIDAVEGNDDDDDEPKIKEICYKSFGVSLLGGYHHSLNYSRFAGFGLQYSLAFHPSRVHSFEYEHYFFPIKQDSYFYGSIPRLSNVSLGYQFRYYFAPIYKPVSPFLAFGLESKVLYWKYKNPVYTDVYDEFGNFILTEEISYDAVFNISSSIGTGVTLFRTNKVNASIGLYLGGTFFHDKTFESFENDLFFPVFFARFNVTFEFSFK